ncbi:hypothetical protein Taro_021194 [Colocasia esculenta]|uniref:Uncharacterized protein n=1 Tax=Colocasia esculenta TaxID=4460 RepID=A0A843V1T1_COLES|nr:hypothetical protein [Colocasia esculenta]
MFLVSIWKSFIKDSIKVLEADIQHANPLASEYPQEHDGACLQICTTVSFLVQRTNCHLAGALGLLRILICRQVSTISIYERKASVREFYSNLSLFFVVSSILCGWYAKLPISFLFTAVIFPSLLQLHRGINDMEDHMDGEVQNKI